MSDDLHDEQVDYLEDKLGLNLTGTQEVANDTKQYFAKRAEEEGLSADEMLTAIDAVNDKIEEVVLEAMGGSDE